MGINLYNMSLQTNPRERKTVVRIGQSLAVAPNKVEQPLLQVQTELNNLLDLQTRRLEKLGDDSPKRQALETSVNTLLNLCRATETTREVIKDAVKHLGVTFKDQVS